MLLFKRLLLFKKLCVLLTTTLSSTLPILAYDMWKHVYCVYQENKKYQTFQYQTAKGLLKVIYLFICFCHPTFYAHHPNKWVVIIWDFIRLENQTFFHYSLVIVNLFVNLRLFKNCFVKISLMYLYQFGVYNNTHNIFSFTIFKDYSIKKNSVFLSLLPCCIWLHLSRYSFLME